MEKVYNETHKINYSCGSVHEIGVVKNSGFGNLRVKKRTVKYTVIKECYYG